jgi:bacteriocin-like protein
MQYQELSDQDLASVMGGVSSSSYSTSTSGTPSHTGNPSVSNTPAPLHRTISTPILPITIGKLLTLPSR